MFVLYDWIWEESSSIESNNSEDEQSSESTKDQEEPSEHESDEEHNIYSTRVHGIPEVTHTVTFKCIGANRDVQHQIVLRASRDALRRKEE